MNYTIIKDEQKFREFIEWLPELKNGEAYYVTLFARKKYCKDDTIKLDKAQLKRFTSDKSYLYSKVKQLECKFGAYTTNGLPIPQDALALYISINPRSYEKAAKNALIKFAKLVTEPYNGYNPQAEVLSEIQTATGTKYYIDFDFDGINSEELYNLIDETKINKSCLRFLQTRGGVHLLVKLDEVDPKFKKSYYMHLSSLPNCDMKGDNIVPVPGCTQGEFVPYFFNFLPLSTKVTV